MSNFLFDAVFEGVVLFSPGMSILLWLSLLSFKFFLQGRVQEWVWGSRRFNVELWVSFSE
jgi:hypothetical protein